MSRVLGGHPGWDLLWPQGDKPAPDHTPRLPGRFSPLVPWIQKGFPALEEVQRVDSHVAGEAHVEAAEPQELTAVAGHGSLSLCHFFAGEHEEDIAGMKQRKGQVQKGDVLAQHVHRLKREHRAPFR